MSAPRRYDEQRLLEPSTNVDVERGIDSIQLNPVGAVGGADEDLGQKGSIIEIDIYEAGKPLCMPMLRPLNLQRPRTARIFLCASSAQARMVFDENGDVEATEYLDKMANASRATQVAKWRHFGTQIISQLNPCDLLSWFSIKEDGFVNLVFPDFASVADARVEGPKWVVQNQIRLSKRAEDKFTIVWFDVRDLHSLPNPELDVALRISQTKNCQTEFSVRVKAHTSLVSRKALHDQEFLALLLLEILNANVILNERATLGTLKNKPITHMYPTPWFKFGEDGDVKGSLWRGERFDSTAIRVRGFQFIKTMVELAEDLEAFLLSFESETSRTFDGNKELGATFAKQLKYVKTRARYSTTRAHLRDKSSEQDFHLHAQVSQERLAQNMSALTIIAAIYLPLSLSAGFLSMQTPFAKLDILIADFACVAVTFITSTVVIYYISKYFLKLRFQMWHMRQRMWNVEIVKMRRNIFVIITSMVVGGWMVMFCFFLNALMDRRTESVVINSGYVVICLIVIFFAFILYCQWRTVWK